MYRLPSSGFCRSYEIDTNMYVLMRMYNRSAFVPQFLVGPNALDVRKDDTPGGVFVERCRFLEETNCKVRYMLFVYFLKSLF